MAGDTANIGKLVVDLLLNDSKFGEAMGKAQRTTGKAMPSMQAAATKAMGAVTTAFKAATVAVGAFGAATVAVGAGFEQQMAMVGALQGLQQTDAAFVSLEAQARKLGSTTEFTATQAAEALEELARAGASVEESIASSDSALVLAGTSAASLADSTQLLVATQRQFGMQATESKRITDVFSAAMRGSLLDFSSLREAMKFAGTAGASFGMSLEQTTAAVAAFRDLGLEGSLAGTNFRMAMIAAAQGTEKQATTLKKYGLTLADINPETNTFIDIVEKMGEVGITASDAVAVFGSRAGSNVAQLAAQTRVGAVNMRDFADELGRSSEEGKDAASMYATIGETVSFASKVAVSALQDLMIEVFQTYAEPLRELIETLPVVLNAVTDAVRAQGPALRKQFADTLGAIGTFLRDNATALADAFVNVMQLLAKLGPLLTGVVQLLVVMARNADALAVALASVFMLAVAVKFAAAISGIAAAFGLGTTAVTVFGTALTVTTGGLFALVVAVGAAVAGIVALIKTMSSARDHTDQLREAQEKLERRTGELAKAEEERLGAVLDDQQERIRERLKTDKDLDDATRRRMESVLRLTAAEASEAVASGRLVQVNGELVDVQQLVAEQGEDAADVVLTLADAAAAEAAAMGKQLDAAEPLLQFYEDATTERLKEHQLRRAAIELGLDESATLAQVQVRVEELTAARGEEAGKAKALRDRVAKGVADAVKAEVQVEFDAQQEIARAKAGGADDSVEKREAAAQKIEDLMARLVQATSKAAGDEVQARRDALARQLTDIDRTFQAAIDLEAQGSAKRGELAARQAEARKLAEKAASDDIIAIKEKEAQEAADKAKKLADQVGRLTMDRASEAVQIERDTQAALADLREQGASDAQLAAVQAAGDRRAAQVRADAERAANDLLLRLRGKALTAREQLEREKAAALEDLSDASAETRAAVEEQYDKRIAKTVRGQVVKALGDAAKAAAKFGQAVVGSAMAGMDAISGLLNTLTGFSFNLQDVTQAAMDSMADAADAEAEATEALAEAQERLAEAQADGKADEIAEAQAELAEAEAALAQASDLAGQGFAQFMTDAVNELVANASVFLDAMVNGAPAALQALAAQLPDLFNQIVEQLPILVDALIENVPSVIFAIVDALPDLLDALLMGLVDVVIAVLDMLPGLITQLLTVVLPSLLGSLGRALPGLLQAVVDALPLILNAIIEAIPIVLQAVIDLLPIMVPALIESTMKIVTTIVQAVPQIVGAVISMVPTLVFTLIAMIPDIIMGVVSNLAPLLSALVAMVPLILIEVLAMLPELAIAIVQAIVFELIPAIPGIIKELFVQLIAGMGKALKRIAEGIWDAIKGFFNIFKRKDDKDKKGKKGAFSGIGYVPATMRMTLHKGEAVIPADRNAQAGGGGMPAPAPAGAAQNGMGAAMGGGGMPPIDIAVMAEGRLLDAVQVQAAKRGHATGVVKEIRRAGGVRVGLSRGRFSAFSSR
jgi:TP901 family phage tail tape measure protein